MNILGLVSDFDRLLGTCDQFLLGRWLADARTWATPGDESEDALLQYNARNQVTLWGPTGQISGE